MNSIAQLVGYPESDFEVDLEQEPERRRPRASKGRKISAVFPTPLVPGSSSRVKDHTAPTTKRSVTEMDQHAIGSQEKRPLNSQTSTATAKPKKRKCTLSHITR